MSSTFGKAQGGAGVPLIKGESSWAYVRAQGAAGRQAAGHGSGGNGGRALPSTRVQPAPTCLPAWESAPTKKKKLLAPGPAPTCFCVKVAYFSCAAFEAASTRFSWAIPSSATTLDGAGAGAGAGAAAAGLAVAAADRRFGAGLAVGLAVPLVAYIRNGRARMRKADGRGARQRAHTAVSRPRAAVTTRLPTNQRTNQPTLPLSCRRS